jgi:hypothetical protein
MKRLLVVALTVCLMTACGLLGGNKNDASKENAKSGNANESKASEPKIAVGDTVVAKWSGDSFYEGKVESIDGSRVRIAWNDKSTPSQVDMVDVYSLPKSGAQPDVKEGSIVLAKRSSGTYWNGAEVTSVSDGVIGVKYTNDGSTGNLAPEKVIKVSPATAADFKGQAGKSDFMSKAQAGTPVRPAGYRPQAGERVLAEWVSKSWYPARVKSVSGGKATIAWDDNSTPSDLVYEKVIPLPTAANSTTPSPGDYLIVKPVSTSGKWDYAQVVSVNGQNVETKSADGNTRSVKPGDYVVVK